MEDSFEHIWKEQAFQHLRQVRGFFLKFFILVAILVAMLRMSTYDHELRWSQALDLSPAQMSGMLTALLFLAVGYLSFFLGILSCCALLVLFSLALLSNLTSTWMKSLPQYSN